MHREIIGISKERIHGLQLSRRDIFVSDEHAAFTRLGSHLYGLFVVHKDAIREATNNGHTSEERLRQMIEKETEQRYLALEEILEEIWGRKVQRDEITSSYTEERFTAVLKEQLTLLRDQSF